MRFAIENWLAYFRPPLGRFFLNIYSGTPLFYIPNLCQYFAKRLAFSFPHRFLLSSSFTICRFNSPNDLWLLLAIAIATLLGYIFVQLLRHLHIMNYRRKNMPADKSPLNPSLPYLKTYTKHILQHPYINSKTLDQPSTSTLMILSNHTSSSFCNLRSPVNVTVPQQQQQKYFTAVQNIITYLFLHFNTSSENEGNKISQKQMSQSPTDEVSAEYINPKNELVIKTVRRCMRYFVQWFSRLAIFSYIWFCSLQRKYLQPCGRENTNYILTWNLPPCL